MIISSSQAIDTLEAAGTISAGDANELRTFAAFLADVGPIGAPGAPGRGERIRAAYAEHYPDDYAAAVALSSTGAEAGELEPAHDGDTTTPVQPAGTRRCTHDDHPEGRHEHYGRRPYACAVGSPLGAEENLGHGHIFAKPTLL